MTDGAVTHDTPDSPPHPSSRWLRLRHHLRRYPWGSLLVGAALATILVALSAPANDIWQLLQLRHQSDELREQLSRLPGDIPGCLRGEPAAFNRLTQTLDQVEHQLSRLRTTLNAQPEQTTAHVHLLQLEGLLTQTRGNVTQLLRLERPLSQLASSLTRAEGPLKELARLTDEFATAKLKRNHPDAPTAHQLSVLTQQIGRGALGLLVNNLGSTPTLQLARDLAQFHQRLRLLKQGADTNDLARLMRIETTAEESFAPLAWLEPLAQAGQAAGRLQQLEAAIGETHALSTAVHVDGEAMLTRHGSDLLLAGLALAAVPLGVMISRRQHEHAGTDTVDEVALERVQADLLAPAHSRLRWLASQIEDSRHLTRQLEQLAEHADILALNTRVEASRLGDPAAGVNLIADEIGSLANHSRQLAHQLAQLASGLDNGTRQALDTLNTLRTQTPSIPDGHA